MRADQPNQSAATVLASAVSINATSLTATPQPDPENQPCRYKALDGEEALETLAFASMFMRRLESTQPTRAGKHDERE